MIYPDPFDSQVTGKRHGVIKEAWRCNEQQLRTELMSWDHVRVALPMHLSWETQSAIFQTIGFRLASVTTMFTGRPYRPAAKVMPQVVFRRPTEDEFQQLVLPQARVFKLSRFSSDPFNFYSTQDIYRAHQLWLLNLHARENLYVRYEVDTKLNAEVPTAFIGFKEELEEGQHREMRVVTIDLIANMNKVPGMGAAAIGELCHEIPCDRVDVKTQVHNHAAMSLYHRVGFRPTTTEVVLVWAANPYTKI